MSGERVRGPVANRLPALMRTAGDLPTKAPIEPTVDHGSTAFTSTRIWRDAGVPRALTGANAMIERAKRLGLTVALTAMLAAGGGAQLAAQEAYSDAKLQSFVVAALAVNELIEHWGPQVEAAESDQQAEALARQAGEEMRAVVENTDGITVEEYRQIIDAVQNDPELKGRIDGILLQMRQQ